MDLAFSGNGEPTSAHEFSAAAQLVGTVLADVGLSDIKLRLITNGSLLHRPEVQAGIAALGALHGEVWFKLDRATLAGMQAVNQINMAPEKVLSNLLRCAQLAPTWVQTCWFTRSGIAPTAAEERAYLALLVQALPNILGVHLYGLARPSCQPEAALLTALSTTELALFAQKITGLGTRTIVSA